MQYVYFALFVIAMIGIIVLISRFDARAKHRARREAYRLLEEKDPDPKVVRSTIKNLRLYGGHWRKDKEFVQLVQRLQQKLGDFNQI